MYISFKVRVSVQLGAMEVWSTINGRHATKWAKMIVQFQQGSFYVTRTKRTLRKITAGALGCFLFLPLTLRAGSPRTRKYTNAASLGARNSALYCVSLCSLELTGAHFASNHGCKHKSPTRELAGMKPTSGRSGKVAPFRLHATQRSNAVRGTRKWM